MKGIPFSALASYPWYSEDASALRTLPQAILFGKRVAARSTETISVDFFRYPGADASAPKVAELPEEEFISLLMAQGQLLWLTAHLEDAASRASGGSFGNWWRALGLDRRRHVPELQGLGAREPGDFDLVLGPWDARLRFDWLVGAEFKRVKFDGGGARKRQVRQKIEKVVSQADGLFQLGFDQAVVVLVVALQAEDIPFGEDGRVARDEVQDRVIEDLVGLVEEIVPREFGVLGVLWDAPPGVHPQWKSTVSILKIRRPMVNPRRRALRMGLREKLERGIQRALSNISLSSPRDVLRICPWPRCSRPVVVRGAQASACPSCHRRWIERPS